MLLIFLIGFFILLIIYQIFLANSVNIEGMENRYREYDTNNPDNIMILVQQNSGNIEFLKNRMDNLFGLDKKVQQLSSDFLILQEQVNNIILEQKLYAEEMLPKDPPDVSGLDYEETEETKEIV